MNDDRDASIPLGAEYTRCIPSEPSNARTLCARARAVIPRQNARVEDYTLRPGNSCSVLCVGYVDVRALRKQAAIAPPPRVHKPLRGM